MSKNEDYNWMEWDKETLNEKIEFYHYSFRWNPYKRVFVGETEKDVLEVEERFQKPLSEYSTTITQFFLEDTQIEQFLGKNDRDGTWKDKPIYHLIFHINKKWYQSLYEEWGIKVFKFYDFVIKNRTELFQMGHYTNKMIMNFFNHDYHLEFDGFSFPRIMSCLQDLECRNHFVSEGKMKGKLLNIPPYNGVYLTEDCGVN